MAKRARPVKVQRRTPTVTLVRQPALRKAMLPEKRVFDTIVNQSPGNGIAQPLMLVPLGAINNARVGNQIRITNIGYKISFNWQPTPAATLGPIIRLMLVHDKQVNGQFPLITDILTGAGTTSYRNYNQLTRFQMLHDETFILDNGEYFNGTLSQSQSSHVFKTHNSKSLNIPILFNDQVVGTPPTIGNIKTNGVFLMVYISASPVIDCTFSGQTRIKYFDA